MNPAPHPTGVPRSVPAERALAWWSDAWQLFMANAALWVAMGLLLIVIFIVLGVIPLLGSIVASVLTPVFVGGWMLAARKQRTGGTLEFGDLFLGFREPLQPLLALGGFFLAGSAVIFLTVGRLGMGAAAAALAGAGGLNGGVLAAVGAGFTALLLGLLLAGLLAMAFWFAPALVVFHGMAPVDAIKASFAANLRNLLPFLLYAVVSVVASIVASIPFGLGWLVLIPLSLLTVYTSAEDIFGA